MSVRWAVRFREEGAIALGCLRLKDVKVCQVEGFLWLCGEQLDQALPPLLHSLPGARRFEVLADRQLVAFGTRVPRGHLPSGPWTSLAEWLRPILPRAALPGRTGERVRLELVRTSSVCEPSLLLTDWKRWRQYATTAPQVRLDRWAFAVSGIPCPAGKGIHSNANQTQASGIRKNSACDARTMEIPPGGRVLVRGTPLPPLPGEALVERDGVAVAAGWMWSPPVAASVVRELFGLDQGDVVLLFPDGSCETVANDDFVRATRSAVRLTEEAAHDS